MTGSHPDAPQGVSRPSLNAHILLVALALGPFALAGCGTPREAAAPPAPAAAPAVAAAPVAAPQPAGAGAPRLGQPTVQTDVARAVAAAAHADPAVPSLSEMLHDAQGRYGDAWYRTLTFRQTTVFYAPDGTTRTETWLEAAEIPGALRIDLPEPGAGNVYLFRGDSTYAFREGELAVSRPEGNPLMLLGFELYHLPVAQTVAAVAALGIDTTVFREGTWNGRPAWVVGAADGDETRPQVWFDRERLVFLRLVERAGPDGSRVQDIRFERYEPLAGGWIAPRVEMYVDGRLVMTEEYADVEANVALPPGTWSPTPAGLAVRWWEGE